MMGKDSGLIPSSQGSMQGAFRPQLTSLVDVMTILLVFLMKSFSVEGTMVTPAPDLQLPVSTSDLPARPVLTIVLTPSAILHEDQRIASVASFAGADSLMIAPLHGWLTQQKAALSLSPELMIQADRSVEFAVVKRVMYTCSRAGFTDFTILTLGEGG